MKVDWLESELVLNGLAVFAIAITLATVGVGIVAWSVVLRIWRGRD